MPSKRKYTSPILDNVTDMEKSQTLNLTQSSILTWRFRCSNRRSLSHLLFWNRRDHLFGQTLAYPRAAETKIKIRLKNETTSAKGKSLLRLFNGLFCRDCSVFVAPFSSVSGSWWKEKQGENGLSVSSYFTLTNTRCEGQTNQFPFINESYNEAWVSSKQVTRQLRRK